MFNLCRRFTVIGIEYPRYENPWYRLSPDVKHFASTFRTNNKEKMTLLLAEKIECFAFRSRYIILILQIIFNNFIPDHDADAFNPPIPSDEKRFLLDKYVDIILGGFMRWDAIYFLHISQYGYTYTNCLAFFPLFPFLVKLSASTVFFPLQYVMGYRHVLIVAAFLLNQYIFVKTAVLVYKLGQKVVGNELIAYKAALLFCINPASIFMSAPYSETLFAFLSFYAMLKFEEDKMVSSAVSVGLSFLTRSNGIIAAGFKLHRKILDVIQGILSMTRTLKGFGNMCIGIWSTFWIDVLPLFLHLIISVLPFVVYQYISYQIHCMDHLHGAIPHHLSTYGKQKGYSEIDRKSTAWCNYTIPVPYGYVQNEIWNVGFLKYYEWKQTPNFILAIPVSILSVCAVLNYVKWNKTTFFSLGIVRESNIYKIEEKKERRASSRRDVFQNTMLLPYTCHLLFLTIFSWFFIHIQVTTRLLFSASPVLYWFASYCITMEARDQQKFNKWDLASFSSNQDQVETEYNSEHKINNVLLDQIVNLRSQSLVTVLIILYFIGYSVIGTFLFSNFLPWT